MLSQAKEKRPVPPGAGDGAGGSREALVPAALVLEAVLKHGCRSTWGRSRRAPPFACPSCFCHPDQRWAGQGLHRRASDRGGAMVVAGGDGVIDLFAVRERLEMLERSDGATPTPTTPSSPASPAGWPVIRPPAARTDDGGRQPGETPRPSRRRPTGRAARPGRPCPATSESVAVIVLGTRQQNSPQVSLIQHDHVVQTFPPDRADHPFDKRVLPRRTRRGHDLFDTHRRHRRADIGSVRAIPIPDQIPRSRVPRERFPELLGDPRRGRVRRDAEVYDPTSLVAKDDEHEQHRERGRRHHEEVDRCQGSDVVVEKRLPCLGRRPRMGHHVLRHGCLGHRDAQLQQLTVDPRRSPRRVLLGHPPDEVSDLPRYGLPATPLLPRLHGPEEPKGRPVPPDNGLRCHDHEGVAPPGPDLGEKHPEYPVGRHQRRPALLPLQDHQLLAQGQDLELQLGAAAEGVCRSIKDEFHDRVHAASVAGHGRKHEDFCGGRN